MHFAKDWFIMDHPQQEQDVLTNTAHLLLQDLGGVRLLQTNIHPKSQKRIGDSTDTPWLGIFLGKRESLCVLASRNLLL